MTAVGEPAHPLDNPVWHALVGPHRELGRNHGSFRRYHPDVAVFGAFEDWALTDLNHMAGLLAPGETVGLAAPGPLDAPPELEIIAASPGVQMLAVSFVPRPADSAFVTLGQGNVPQMVELVTMTRPGPFAARTREMGRYVGLFDDERLIAMAGERMRLPGYTEVSAVCTHPDYRGRGYAKMLVTEIASGIVARGETPFLHTYADNALAIATYEKLGFVLRSTINFVVLRKR